MTTGLPELDRARLAKFCGMLGSDHDGERAAAALLATRLLRQRGLTWADVVSPAPARDWRSKLTRSPPPRPPAPPQEPPAWRMKALQCQRRPELLTPWEAGFLASLRRRTGSITLKQMAALDAIAAKVGAA